MNQSNTVGELIRRAREGDREALGDLLDKHRAYLKILSQRHLDGALAARVDASDVVQQTLLSVFRNFEQFDGCDDAQFLAWIRKIHERNVQDVVRDHTRAARRALGRESPPDEATVPEPVAASPSQRAMLGEAAVRLARAVERLPDDQREAVRLRHLEGRTLADMARQMERSEQAVAGLVKRGLKNLRKQLDDT